MQRYDCLNMNYHDLMHSHVHFKSLMATGVQMDFFIDDRTLGLTIGHLTTPLYTSPKAPSPRRLSMMISLAGISQLSGRGAVVDRCAKTRVFDRPWKIESHGSLSDNP